MSTRETIWFGEDDKRSVHIYWELSKRRIENGRMVAAPIHIAIEDRVAVKETVVPLPKELGSQLLVAFTPVGTEKAIEVI